MRLLSVNTGHARPIDIMGCWVLSAISKRVVRVPVAVQPMGLAGDEQADPQYWGTRMAVYMYPSEHLDWWVPPGRSGPRRCPATWKNLSISGLLDEGSTSCSSTACCA